VITRQQILFIFETLWQHHVTKPWQHTYHWALYNNWRTCSHLSSV
jgi:hypothetical protein